MLYDQDFLNALDSQKNKTIYARITALRFDETPIESIEGRVTGGSINLDGASAVRRTCSLTIVAENYDYNNYYWGLNTKFKLDIGVKNTVDSNYPEIIWFKQGLYLITSFNTSRSTNNFSVSISGKDKMCLLNGEVSGNLESQVDFGTIEEEDMNGVWTKRKIPIAEIIKNAVHVYGNEPLHNIIINDLPDHGLELLEYRYDLPLYFYKEKSSNLYDNVLIDGSKLCRIGSANGKIVALKDLKNEHLERLVDDMVGIKDAADIFFDDSSIQYTVAKVEYGQTAGYRETELVYAGDLIANIGESLVSVLDKIKNMLGEFEYFYDVDGRFIFQQKRTYVNLPWSPIGKDENGEAAVLTTLAEASATAYTFNGGELITQFNNNPNLMNVRNDFMIRGERTGISGSVLAIHMRYAIDTKPTEYTSIFVADNEVSDYNNKYKTSLTGQGSTLYSDKDVDWREIIYQMARDYYRYSWMEDFELRVAKANKDNPDSDYSLGRTGYEQYYTDLISFWRDIYYPAASRQNDYDSLVDKIDDKKDLINGLQKEINGELVDAIQTAQDKLKVATDDVGIQKAYTELIVAKAKLEIAKEELVYQTGLLENYEKDLMTLEQKMKNFDGDWNVNKDAHPELLNFWFDFFDVNGDLSNFNVKAIGSRTKTVNDSNIKSIYFKDTPDVIFVSSMTSADKNDAYTYIQVPEDMIDEMFSISGQGISAKTKLDELVNQHGYCAETATITTVPIYHLDTNVRIHLFDKDSGLDGDYTVSKVTIPLAYNGTMSITATKVPDILK